jgi:hypothetical protein
MTNNAERENLASRKSIDFSSLFLQKGSFHILQYMLRLVCMYTYAYICTYMHMYSLVLQSSQIMWKYKGNVKSYTVSEPAFYALSNGVLIFLF